MLKPKISATTTTTTTTSTTSTTAAPTTTTTTAAPPTTTTTTTTTAPTVTWYCSQTYLDRTDVFYARFTSTYDASGSSYCYSNTTCSTGGYPAYPPRPTC